MFNQTEHEYRIEHTDEKMLIETITKTIKDLEKKKLEKKTAAENLDEYLHQDPQYGVKKAVIEEKQVELRQSKQRIIATDKGFALNSKIKDINQEIKDIKVVLATQAEILYQKTKKTEFTDSLGIKRKIRRKFDVINGQQSLFP